MQPLVDTVLSVIVLALGVRTLAWHLQNWQIREYRFDRLQSRMKTREGLRDIFSLWFFRGIFPRPQASARVFIILFFIVLLLFADFFSSFSMTQACREGQGWWLTAFGNWCTELEAFWGWPMWLNFLVFERFMWLYVAIAVWLSRLPVWVAKKFLFGQAKGIIHASGDNVIKIAITGSYGKSSTKEILAHLLEEYFEPENVLYNPANDNHEIAVARLIKAKKDFFLTKSDRPKICVIETGAYRRGDLKKVADFFQPEISILTAIGTQHLDLFGSQRNIQLAKFELAEGTKEKVFFNSDNELLQEIFSDRKITAVPIGMSKASVEEIQAFDDSTSFSIYGEFFALPWPGKFFVTNAVLALEVARELGVPVEKLPGYLSSLPPLERALNLKKNPRNILLYEDLYSSNADGVLEAIKHLGKANGERIFVGLPILELGEKSVEIHEQIFSSLKKIKANVWWLKNDYADLAKSILGKNFHGNDVKELKKLAEKLGEQDGVLLEGRLPQGVVKLFE